MDAFSRVAEGKHALNMRKICPDAFRYLHAHGHSRCALRPHVLALPTERTARGHSACMRPSNGHMSWVTKRTHTQRLTAPSTPCPCCCCQLLWRGCLHAVRLPPASRPQCHARLHRARFVTLAQGQQKCPLCACQTVRCTHTQRKHVWRDSKALSPRAKKTPMLLCRLGKGANASRQHAG